jgi:hypothetical protein
MQLRELLSSSFLLKRRQSGGLANQKRAAEPRSFTGINISPGLQLARARHELPPQSPDPETATTVVLIARKP